VVVVACEPADVGDLGFGLSERVQGVLDRAVELVVETVDELRGVAMAATDAG
jgi:Ni,Fe-hydrogenase maturation factor